MTDDYREEPYPSRSSRQQHKKKHTVVRPLLGAALILLCLTIGIIGGFGLIGNWLDFSKTTVDISTLPEDEQQAARDERALANVDILLIGCDTRQGEAARADTIMLVTLRPVDKEISLLSIPRDTYTAVAGHGKTKINHALAYGGMPLLQETVENLLDVEIDYTVQVNFEGFKDIIDAMGGVTIDVEQRMYKPLENIDLQPGEQRLNGYDALAYVRWRGDGRADIGRIERQQKFLAALVEGVKNMNLKEALDVAAVVMDNIETNMSVADMTRYGTKYLGLTAADVETHSLTGSDLRIDGISYYEVSQDEIDRVMTLMKYGVPEEAPTEGENAEGQTTENETEG